MHISRTQNAIKHTSKIVSPSEICVCVPHYPSSPNQGGICVWGGVDEGDVRVVCM